MDQLFASVRVGDFSTLDVDIRRNGSLILSVQKYLRLNGIRDRKALEKIVRGENFFENRWTRFNIVLESFLEYCRDVVPFSLWESCFPVIQYYEDVCRCLTNDSTMYPVDSLVPVFRMATEAVIPMVTRLDENYTVIGTRPYQFLTHAASIISKLFNSIKSRADEDKVIFEHLSGKQQILLYIANKLNLIYFRMNSPSSCSNIFKNLKPKSNILSFKQYPVVEQVQYIYYLGRYFMLNHRVTNAFHQFNQCYKLLLEFSDCPAKRSNMKKLLKFLVPCGIVIGKLPNLNLVAHVDPDLAQRYARLVNSIKAGNINDVFIWLFENEQWLKSSKLLLLMLEKIPVLTFRSLLRSIFIHYSLPRGTNKVPYSVIRPLLAKSIGAYPAAMPAMYRENFTPESLENILVTLSILQFWKGNVFPSLKVCVTMKTTDINLIFPNMNEKIVARFSPNPEEVWLEN